MAPAVNPTLFSRPNHLRWGQIGRQPPIKTFRLIWSWYGVLRGRKLTHLRLKQVRRLSSKKHLNSHNSRLWKLNKRESHCWQERRLIPVRPCNGSCTEIVLLIQTINNGLFVWQSFKFKPDFSRNISRFTVHVRVSSVNPDGMPLILLCSVRQWYMKLMYSEHANGISSFVCLIKMFSFWTRRGKLQNWQMEKHYWLWWFSM